MDEKTRGLQIKAQLDAVSPSFCLAKWKQTTLHLHNGHTQSCHHVKSHAVDPQNLADPAALHNTPEKIIAREQMLKGERPSECDYCWRMEDRGEISDRVWKSATKWAWPLKEEVLEERLSQKIIPSYLEISFDSACQFKCMYCGPAYSTKWQKELEEFGPYPTTIPFNSLEVHSAQGTLPKTEEEKNKYIEAFWKWWPELSPRLKHLRVTGGEPFLSRETFKLIDELIAKPQPHLNFSINTNMGLSLQQREAFLARIEALQSSVKKVIIFTSIDTVGAQAEYIRFGLNHKNYWENIEAVLSQTKKPLLLSFMITVNNLCLPGLKNLMERIQELRLKFPNHEIGIDTPYLRHPLHLSVELLPKSFAVYIDQTVEFMTAAGFSEGEILRVSRIRELITKSAYTFLERMTLKGDFFKMFTEYDRRRGTDFLKTFPEYQSFWTECSRYANA